MITCREQRKTYGWNIRESLCQIFGCETLVCCQPGVVVWGIFVRCTLAQPSCSYLYTIGKTSAALVFRCSPFVQCPCQAFIRPPKCYVTFAILHSNKFNRTLYFFCIFNRHLVSMCKTFVANSLIDAQYLYDMPEVPKSLVSVRP